MVLMSLLKYLAANMADVNCCCLLSVFTVRTAIIGEKNYTIFWEYFWVQPLGLQKSLPITSPILFRMGSLIFDGSRQIQETDVAGSSRPWITSFLVNIIHLLTSSTNTWQQLTLSFIYQVLVWSSGLVKRKLAKSRLLLQLSFQLN